MTILILLAALILSGCACQSLLDADRSVNSTLFNGNPHKTITTEQFAEKNNRVVCGALNFIILPYDLFCADEILNHCEYWREYENRLLVAEEKPRNQSPVDQTIEPCVPPETGCTVIISKYRDGSVTRRIARCDKQGECKVEGE